MVTDDTVGNGGGKQRLDGTKDSDSDGGRDESLDDLPRELGHLGTRQLIGDREPVTNGLYRRNAHILLEQQGCNRHQDDGNQ